MYLIKNVTVKTENTGPSASSVLTCAMDILGGGCNTNRLKPKISQADKSCG